MKHQVILEFETDDTLESQGHEYTVKAGGVVIAREMIILALLENQQEVLIRAKTAEHKGEWPHAKFIRRFHNTLKTLKVVGYIDNQHVMMKDEYAFKTCGRME